MRKLQSYLLNLLCSINCRIRKRAVDRQLQERYLSVLPTMASEVSWTECLKTPDVIKIIDYKDEKWCKVEHLKILMLLHSLGLYTGVEKTFTPIGRANRKIKITSQGHLHINSNDIHDDWIYLSTHGKIFSTVRLDMRVTFHSIFKEFQLAYRHKSLFERMRFRIVDGKNLVAEIVTKGFFSKPIAQIPFEIEIGREYAISLICIKSHYQLVIDGVIVMEIYDKYYKGENGELAIILWDDKPESNIFAEISSCEIYNVSNP